MQNYAKFESNSLDSGVQVMSERSSSYQGISENVLSYVFQIIDTILDMLIIFIIFVGILLFFYILISLFKKGPEQTALEIKKLLNWGLEIIRKFFLQIKKIILYFWNRKILSFSIILILIAINFIFSVLDGKSKILKMERINSGFVGVDLKNERILTPGIHLYSPIFTSFFLSPTNSFSFEVAEITANTSEELGITLDYRVNFIIEPEKRLEFYKKYGAKNIKEVSSDIVMPNLLEVIKGIIKNYGFKDIRTKQDEIKDITIKETNKILKDIGIELQSVIIIDVRLPKNYSDSKEALLNAENELKLAEAKLEAEKKESERKLMEAENNKKIKVIEAQGIAEYNKIIASENITEEMLKMKKLENEREKIEKWDGKLPTTVGNSFGFID